MPEGRAKALSEGRALFHRQVRRRASLLSARRARARSHAPVRVPPAAAREAEDAALLPDTRETIPLLLSEGLATARRDRRELVASARMPPRQRPGQAGLCRLAPTG